MEPSRPFSRVSLFAIRLEQRRRDRPMGYGTGFVYKHAETNKLFLVTNFHVLTGRDPANPSMLEPGYPDSPDELAWSVFTRPNFTVRVGSFSIDGNTQWLEHRRRSEGVDLAAIALSFPDDAVILTQEDLKLDTNLQPHVGMEVFIVGYPYGFIGYPYGFSVHDIHPIWKRGTIASEPRAIPDGIDKFYVDAYSHPGMSGSPVFAVVRRELIRLLPEAARLYQAHKRGKISALEFIQQIDPSELERGKFDGMALKLIGVYSGRVRMPGNRDANLGIVYGASCLEEIFTEPIPTGHPFPPQ